MAIVTGAGKGLGKAFCISLAQEGANIVAVTRADAEGLEKTGEEVRSLGKEALLSMVDVSSEKDTLRIAQETLNRFGRIDILVKQRCLLLRRYQEAFHRNIRRRVGQDDGRKRARSLALCASRVSCNETVGKGKDNKPCI